MKIGSDGSLPRITSSFKGLTSDLKISKVPDDQIGESGIVYKLVWTGRIEDESELSEKSEDEVWSEEEEILDSQLPEKDNKVHRIDSNYDKITEENKPQNVEFARQHKNNNNKRFRQNYNRKYNHVKRNLNASGEFNSPNLMVSRNDERNSFNFNNRSFGSSGNYGRNYNPSLQNSNLIEPWLVPPTVVPTAQNFQLPTFPYGSVINHPVQTPPNPVIENPAIQKPKSVGLLGVSPYDLPRNFSIPPNYLPSKQNDEFISHQPNYKPNNQKDEFISRPPNYQPSNQNEEFIPCPPNYQPGNQNEEFIGAQNYYDKYNDYPNNYYVNNFQRSGHPNKSMDRPPNQKKFNPRNNRWRNNKRRNNWKRQKSYVSQEKEERNKRHYDYRK